MLKLEGLKGMLTEAKTREGILAKELETEKQLQKNEAAEHKDFKEGVNSWIGRLEDICFFWGVGPFVNGIGGKQVGNRVWVHGRLDPGARRRERPDWARPVGATARGGCRRGADVVAARPRRGEAVVMRAVLGRWDGASRRTRRGWGAEKARARTGGCGCVRGGGGEQHRAQTAVDGERARAGEGRSCRCGERGSVARGLARGRRGAADEWRGHLQGRQRRANGAGAAGSGGAASRAWAVTRAGHVRARGGGGLAAGGERAWQRTGNDAAAGAAWARLHASAGVRGQKNSRERGGVEQGRSERTAEDGGRVVACACIRGRGERRGRGSHRRSWGQGQRGSVRKTGTTALTEMGRRSGKVAVVGDGPGRHRASASGGDDGIGLLPIQIQTRGRGEEWFEGEVG
nr:spidroin-1-like [Aegilops tauschii subsp. strangulata]